MLLLLLNYVVLRALWNIDLHLISTLVNTSLYYYLLLLFIIIKLLYKISKTHIMHCKYHLCITYALDV